MDDFRRSCSDIPLRLTALFCEKIVDKKTMPINEAVCKRLTLTFMAIFHIRFLSTKYFVLGFLLNIFIIYKYLNLVNHKQVEKPF